MTTELDKKVDQIDWMDDEYRHGFLLVSNKTKENLPAGAIAMCGYVNPYPRVVQCETIPPNACPICIALATY